MRSDAADKARSLPTHRAIRPRLLGRQHASCLPWRTPLTGRAGPTPAPGWRGLARIACDGATAGEPRSGRYQTQERATGVAANPLNTRGEPAPVTLPPRVAGRAWSVDSTASRNALQCPRRCWMPRGSVSGVWGDAGHGGAWPSPSSGSLCFATATYASSPTLAWVIIFRIVCCSSTTEPR
jgi:hypothetical protein